MMLSRFEQPGSPAPEEGSEEMPFVPKEGLR